MFTQLMRARWQNIPAARKPDAVFGSQGQVKLA
jgi:hypothetical protein